jgi:hypothetical protein
VGAQNYGSENGGTFDFWPVINAYYYGKVFCNHSIAINGQFQIRDENSTGCLAINSTTGLVDVDTASACATNGGDGYPWDRWTAIGIKYHSQQLWVLRSAAYPSYCLHADLPNANGVSAADWVPLRYQRPLPVVLMAGLRTMTLTIHAGCRVPKRVIGG